MGESIRRLRRGDPCPCCGQPIETDDPDVLALLTEIENQGWTLVTLETLNRILERRKEMPPDG